MTEIKSKPYHYRECGLDDVYLANGFVLEDSSYGQSVAIEDVDLLHEAIGRTLCEKRELNAKEVRFLRHELGLSQKRLGELLGVEEQTVSLWERAAHPIQSSAAMVLKFLFLESINEDVSVRQTLEELADLECKIAELRQKVFLLQHERTAADGTSAKAYWSLPHEESEDGCLAVL